ncbi:MAG: hypothetical protein KC414_02230, partial [Romboutsia sp.]|nr:hypothetical protein [Romboutsia sp.]
MRQEPGVANDFFIFRFSDTPGANPTLRNASRIEYNFLDVMLGYSWDWGSISLGKGNTTYGHERNGNIIISDRPSSYPNLRLDIKPLDWLSFNYLHGWLNSNIVDTSAAYSTFRYRGNENTDRQVYIQKYLAIHSITVEPYKNLTFSFGESVIYKGEPKYQFLIPIVPFSILGGYIGNEEKSNKFNTQFFMSLSSKNHIPNTHLYLNYLIDEFSATSVYDSLIDYSKYALSMGASIVDIPINNLTLDLEYTKVFPSTYQHFNPALTYASFGFLNSYAYTLGHWAGDNTEIIYGSLNYRIIRGLDFT